MYKIIFGIFLIKIKLIICSSYFLTYYINIISQETALSLCHLYVSLEFTGFCAYVGYYLLPRICKYFLFKIYFGESIYNYFFPKPIVTDILVTDRYIFSFDECGAFFPNNNSSNQNYIQPITNRRVLEDTSLQSTSTENITSTSQSSSTQNMLINTQNPEDIQSRSAQTSSRRLVAPNLSFEDESITRIVSRIGQNHLRCLDFTREIDIKLRNKEVSAAIQLISALRYLKKCNPKILEKMRIKREITRSIDVRELDSSDLTNCNFKTLVLALFNKAKGRLTAGSDVKLEEENNIIMILPKSNLEQINKIIKEEGKIFNDVKSFCVENKEIIEFIIII